MNSLSKFAYARTNIFICAFLTIAMVLYASIVMGSQSKCVAGELADEYSLLGLRIGYSHEYALALLGMLSREGLECYAKLLRLWDNLFPLFYGSMYIAWISLIYRNIRLPYDRLHLLNLFPLLPAITDLIENYFEIRLISEFLTENTIASGTYRIASGITLVKWIFSGMNYVLIITGLAWLVINAYRRRKSK